MMKMGSSFKNGMFDENISESLANWAETARRRKRVPVTSEEGAGIQMTNNAPRDSSMEQGSARLI
jgi:mlo protein